MLTAFFPPAHKMLFFPLLLTKTSRNTCILCQYKRITVLSSVGVSMQHPTFGRYITRAVCWVGGWNSHWINYWLEWRGLRTFTAHVFLFFFFFLFRLGRHIIPDPANHLPTSECVCALLWHNKQSIPPHLLNRKKIPAGVLPKGSGEEQRPGMLSCTSRRFMTDLSLITMPVSQTAPFFFPHRRPVVERFSGAAMWPQGLIDLI